MSHTTATLPQGATCAGPAPGGALPGPTPQLGVLCLSGSLGGLELNSLKFAGWMQERGWRVTFFAPPATALATWAEEWFVPLETLAVRRGAAMPLLAWALKQQLERLHITVLVVTQNKDLPAATLAKTFMGGRLRIIYQQHMQLGRSKRSLVHTLRFNLIDAWLTPLPGLAAEVGRLTRLDARKLHVVPLGLPLEQFARPTHTPAEARHALGLPPRGPLLGILGRLDSGKGQDFVIDVLHHLRRDYGSDAQLVIMGELTRHEGDSYLHQLREQVDRLGLQAQVHFRAFQANPAVFFRAIDVFVLASESETYGMVTLEALAASVPVVAAATGGTPELVEHNRTGLLYLRRDVAACARAVQRALTDPAATQARATAARLGCWRYAHQRQCALTEDVIWAVCTEAAPSASPARPVVALQAAFAR